jgi:hypothetical protein
MTGKKLDMTPTPGLSKYMKGSLVPYVQINDIF